jgi:hypothetical protein
MSTCHMSVELGAYVLHALEDRETEQVRRHVDDCPTCQAEVRDLSFTASLLALLRPGDLAALDSADDAALPASDGSQVAGRDRRFRTRRGRRAQLAVALALLAALTVPVTRASFEDHQAPTAASTMLRANDLGTHVRAAVTLAAQDDGTDVHLTLAGAYPGDWCSLVARSRDGQVETAATWRADDQGTADVAGTTAIPSSRLSELDVVTDDGHVLVRIPVHGQDT